MGKKKKKKIIKKTNTQIDKMLNETTGVIQKPLKIPFLILIITAVLSGFVGGIVGDFINEKYIKQEYNIPKQIILEQQKKNSQEAVHINNKDEKKLSIFSDKESDGQISTLKRSIIEIYKKKDNKTKELLDNVYLPKERIGQGFALTNDGWIITTTSNISKETKPDELIAITSNNEIFEINEFTIDPITEIVFIKLEAKNLPIAKLGQIEKSDITDDIVIFDSDNKIINGKILQTHYTPLNNKEDFIQNSEKYYKYILINNKLKSNLIGSPVINNDGEIIGIVHTITGNNETLILPIETINPIIKNIFTENKAIRTYLGLKYIDLTMLKGITGITDLTYINQGALIEDVIKDSPANTAELKKGDIILKIEDDVIDKTTTLTKLIQEYPPESEIKLIILQDSLEKEIMVKLKPLI